MFDWATVAAAGVGVLGNLAGIGASANLNGRNRRWQSAEAEKAYQRQRQFYKDFSSPSALMTQYRDAGVNPNYVLSNGGISSPSAPNVPQANTPETFDVGQQVSQGFGRVAQLVQNGDLIKSQSNKNNAEANNINLKTPKELEKLGYDTDTAKEVAKLAGANQEMDLQLKNQELQLKTAETATQQAMANVYHWQALNSKFEFENMKPLEMQQIQTAITKDLAQVDLMIAQKNLTEQEAKLAVAQIYKTYMDAVSNRISANAQMVGAKAQQQMADNQSKLIPSQIQVNESIATANNAKAANLTIDTDTRAKSQHFVLESMRTSNEILGKQNRWYNARQTGEMIRDIGVGIGSALGGASNAIKSIGAMAVGAPNPIGFR